MKVSNLSRFGTSASIALLLSLFASVSLAQEKIFKDDIQSFDLNQANAEEVAEILNEQFSPISKSNEFSANKSTNTIYVRIPAELVPEVQEFIDRLELEAEKTKAEEAARNEAKMAKEARQQSVREIQLKIYALRHADAEELLNVIGELGFHNQQLSIAAAPSTNSIVARGDAASLQELEALLLNLDRPSEATSGSQYFDVDELARLKREYQSLLKSPFDHGSSRARELKRQIESIERRDPTATCSSWRIPATPSRNRSCKRRTMLPSRHRLDSQSCGAPRTIRKIETRRDSMRCGRNWSNR